jgi:hypothetical protein
MAIRTLTYGNVTYICAETWRQKGVYGLRRPEGDPRIRQALKRAAVYIAPSGSKQVSKQIDRLQGKSFRLFLLILARKKKNTTLSTEHGSCHGTSRRIQACCALKLRCFRHDKRYVLYIGIEGCAPIVRTTGNPWRGAFWVCRWRNTKEHVQRES